MGGGGPRVKTSPRDGGGARARASYAARMADGDPFEQGLPTIDAARVRLRALAPGDAEEVFQLYADKDAVRFGFAPRMDDLDDARRLVAETRALVEQRKVFHWGVAERERDRIVGHATLFAWDPRHGRAELGYSIRRDRWGLGLGTEAARALVGFGFERLGLRRVEADVDPRNVGSIRVLEKLGFVREGLLRERWEVGGELQDGVFFGLLRRELRPPAGA